MGASKPYYSVMGASHVVHVSLSHMGVTQVKSHLL